MRQTQEKNLKELELEFRQVFDKYQRSLQEQESYLILAIEQTPVKPTNVLDQKRSNLLEDLEQLNASFNIWYAATQKPVETSSLMTMFGAKTPNLDQEKLLTSYREQLISFKERLAHQGWQLELLGIQELKSEFEKEFKKLGRDIEEQEKYLLKSTQSQREHTTIKQGNRLSVLLTAKELGTRKQDLLERCAASKNKLEALQARLQKHDQETIAGISEQQPIILKSSWGIELESYQEQLPSFEQQLHKEDQKLESLKINEEFLEIAIKEADAIRRGSVESELDRAKNLEAMQDLLARGANVNFGNRDGSSAIYFAIRRHNIPLVIFLLSAPGISVNHVSENSGDSYAKERVGDELQHFSGFSRDYLGTYSAADAELTDQIISRKPLEVAFTAGDIDVALLIILKGADLAKAIKKEQFNTRNNETDPRRSPLISVAMMNSGQQFSIETLLGLQEKFGTNILSLEDGEFSAGKSAKAWATQIILQKISPDDLKNDLKYFLDNDRKESVEFLIPLIRESALGNNIPYLEEFKNKGWQVEETPRSRSSSSARRFSLSNINPFPRMSPTFSSSTKAHSPEYVGEKKRTSSGLGSLFGRRKSSVTEETGHEHEQMTTLTLPTQLPLDQNPPLHVMDFVAQIESRQTINPDEQGRSLLHPSSSIRVFSSSQTKQPQQGLLEDKL